MRALIGIDLGGTNCRGALVQGDGVIVRRQRIATPRATAPEPLFEGLVRLCGELAEATTPDAIGIGIPGSVSSDGTVTLAPNLPALNGLPLAEMLQMRLGIPVQAANDVNAIAWGEALYGVARGLDSFVCLTLGTGVGGALVLDRRLWVGRGGLAGEIGHMTVVPGGRRCGCGNHGCLEAYASAGGLLQNAMDAGCKQNGSDALSVARLAEAAAGGDASAQAAFAQAGRLLGQALAGVVALLDPGQVIFCGGVSASLPLMRPALETELLQRCRTGAAANLHLLTGRLGEDAGILGAAALAGGLVRHP